MTGSYNNFFRVFDRNLKKDYTLEATKDVAMSKAVLVPRKVRNVFFDSTKSVTHCYITFFNENICIVTGWDYNKEKERRN